MTMREITERLGKIEVSMSRIEQHLKDMNGRLLRHDEHILNKCPEMRKDIYTVINELKSEDNNQNKTIAKYGVIITIVNAVMIATGVALATGGI